MRKGIILAGGCGTRLHPLTLAVSKQLLPVYEKPMIYYPLSVLMMAGIRDILVISTPQHLPQFQQLLQDGSQWGISLSYAPQQSPQGIAQAFIIGKRFIDDGPSCLVLGDNIFHGENLHHIVQDAAQDDAGALIFAYAVNNPSRYGVVEFDAAGKGISIEEKPKFPKSRYAVTGLYFFDHRVVSVAEELKPSDRGELEISDVNRWYLDSGDLQVKVMGRGMAWLDAGTHESLLEASLFIETIEKRQGMMVCCPEEIAYRMEFIDREQLETIAHNYRATGYGVYLKEVAQEQNGLRLRVNKGTDVA